MCCGLILDLVGMYKPIKGDI